MAFLGHYIKDNKLMMDESKVKAIQEWDPPTKVPPTKVFLRPKSTTNDGSSRGIQLEQLH